MSGAALKGKTAMITGGGGGIGRAITLRLADAGAKVCIVGTSRQSLDAAVETLLRNGSDAVGVQADVASKTDVRRAFDEAAAAFGQIHILVNAAGIQGPIGLTAEIPADEWIRTLNVNLTGTFLCMQAALPSMVRERYGKIINFSGGGATSSRARFSAYAASKTAVVRLTEIAAEEYRPFGIDINAVAPGAVNTRMLEAVLQAGREAAGPEFADALDRKERGGTPPEVAADLVLFLSSSASDGITGRLISAPWDPWRDEGFRERLRSDKDLATLRRIDDKNFMKRKA
jgi:NAD(P)-dependent dehydrogenase (short-subunit alcohol dehydrogenase family)